MDVAISDNEPSSTGGDVVSYSITPSLPAGLSLDTSSGVISGTPTELSTATDYTVTATNTGGAATVAVSITVNDVAPSALSYATNSVIYTKDVGITDNTPSSAGGAVVSYSITPSLPTGLSLDTASGVISGTPTALSTATSYVVTATNSGGSATVTLRVTVNDVQHVVILLEGTDGSRDMRVTFNGTGSWTTSESTVSAFTYADSNVANSSDASLGGSSKEGFHDYLIIGGNAMNAALSGSFTGGQYVAFDTSVAMTADGGPSSFNVIGLLFDDDSDPTAGEDDVILVTDQADTSSWPSGTEISYTVGASTAFSLDSGIGATFDEAFNKDIYTLDDGVVGSLKVAETVAPVELAYSVSPAIYPVGVAIAYNEPSSTGSAVDSYSITPSLPAGLSLDTVTGVISGTPTELRAATDYTVTATNAGGSATTTVRITANDGAPGGGPVLQQDHFDVASLGLFGGVNVSVVDGQGFSNGTHGQQITDIFLAKTNHARLTKIGGWGRYRLSGRTLGATNARGYIKHVLEHDEGIFWSATDDSPMYSKMTASQWFIEDNRAFFKDARKFANWMQYQNTLLIMSVENSTITNSGLPLYCDDFDGKGWIPPCGAFSDYIAHSGVGIANTIFVGAIDTRFGATTANGAIRADGVFAPHTIYAESENGLTSQATSVLAAYATNLAFANPTWGAARLKQELIELSREEIIDYRTGATNSEGANVVESRTIKAIRPAFAPEPFSHEIAITEGGLGGDEPTVVGGIFGEDALTYSDQTHQHNGAAFNDDGVLDSAGGNIVPLPSYLVGNPYYRFANNAHDNASYVGQLTSDVGCYWYLLIDNRLDGPNGDLKQGNSNTEDAILGGTLQWVIDGGWQRVNTGISPNGQADYTGLDEGGDAEGPGLGLNQFYSVWVLPDLSTSVTVNSNGISSSNMISVVAAQLPPKPANLTYSANPAVYTVGVAITDNVPSSTGGAVVAYWITPALPAGLSFDLATGVISGTPSSPSAATAHTITAANSRGLTTATVVLAVTTTADEAPPSALTYSANPAVYTVGAAITDNVPSSTGGAVVACSITPALPAGLNFDLATGVISGTPTEPSAATDYTVTATNTGGSATVTVSITVNDVAPSALSYSANPAVYTVGVAISDNAPSSTGGAVVSYSITPALPAGLSLDTASGVISGTPTELSAVTDYTVTATNTGGSATVTVSITVNDVAPSALSYATNSVIYTKDVGITDNTLSSAGGAVVSYSITPSLPTGLSFDTATGVISGTPSALSTATSYVVSATNSGGSATVTLRMTVNDVQHVVILLEGTDDSRDMRVTFNGTGSWTTSGSTVSAFTYAASNVANSSDASLGGSGKEGFDDYSITGGNAMNAALSGSFTGGQYVALTTSIAMTADAGPSSFNVIGLLFDDDSDPTAGEDDVILVTDQADTSSWPSGTEISYTAGASTTFSLDSGIGATFDEAFNKDIYTLDDGVVGSLKVAEPVPPAELAYSVSPAIYPVGVATAYNEPSSTGSAVDSYSITPSLPAGLSLDTVTGVISGTPTELRAATDYTVTATNAGGSATTTVRITVSDGAPGGGPILQQDHFDVTISGLFGGVNVSVVDGQGFSNGTHGQRITDIFLAKTNHARLTKIGGWGRYRLNGRTLSGTNASGYIKHVLEHDEGIFWSATDDSPSYSKMTASQWFIEDNRAFFKDARKFANWMQYQNTLLIMSVENPTVVNSDFPLVPLYCDDFDGEGSWGWVPLCGAFSDYIAHSGIGIANTVFVGAIDTRVAERASGAIRADGVFAPHTIYVESENGSTSQATPVLAAYATNLAFANPTWGAARLKQELIELSREEVIDYRTGATNSEGATVLESRTIKAIRPAFAPEPFSHEIAITEGGLNGDEPTVVDGIFGEEALAYSDRTHQHNGAAFNDDGVLDTAGAHIVPLPSYLVGSPYYRFANNARDNAGYVGNLTSDVECYWYLLIDNRLDGPNCARKQGNSNTEDAILGGTLQWVIDDGWQRVNTGISPNGQADYTGLDEGGDAEGPGLGLNQFYSVWVLPDLSTSVTVNSNGISSSNMISVVAAQLPPKPANLTYSANPAVYTVGEAITDNVPSSTGGAGVAYWITPALPAGLSFDLATGVISGTPSSPSAATAHTITAANSSGLTTATVVLAVTTTADEASPSALTYSANPAVYTVGAAITDNVPSSTGGAVVACSITPALPAGLNFDLATGVISGTPTELSAVTDYTVTATNTEGSATVAVSITVNDVAPSALSYATNSVIYTKDVGITDNTPSSAGGAVVSYSITPSLPTGLSFDTATGVISGTPSALSTATSYVVTVTNSGGSATVTLRMTVNDVQHVVILLEGTDDSRDMRVTFNGTGSWTTSGSTVSAFTYADSNVANSSDASLGGSGKEGFDDYSITGGNAMNAALSGSFTGGQYVAFASSIAMTADGGPSSFNVIGLLFDDDSDPTAGQDDVILVTDQADTSSWPSATEISYTVGASTTFSLDSGVGATFDEAFNKDIYTLDDGVVGSLKIAEPVPPAELAYSVNSAVYTVGLAITDNEPSSTGSAVDSYSITPALPAGLSLDTSSGVISGTPTELSAEADYTVTATNAGGSATVTLRITVNDVALDIVAHWPLDEADGTSVANAVGLHNGTVRGSAEWKPGEGKFGGAIYFDGSDGFIEVPDASDFRFAEDESWAVSLWYKTDTAPSNNQGLITKGYHDTTRSGDGYWLLQARSDTSFGFGSRPGSGSTPRVQISSDSGISHGDDQWHHFVVTRDGPLEEIRLYVDGQLTQHDASGTDQGMWAMGDNDDPLVIANHFNRYTPGWFDDIAIWKGYALTDSDVTAISEGLLSDITKAPGALTYSVNPAIYTVGLAITDNEPSSTGSAVDSYSITPALPAGLSLSTSSGVISGTPTDPSAATDYTVTATNSGGSATVTVSITVNDVAPSALSYATNPATYPKDVAITDNGPSSTGGDVVSYSITPSLPAGLSLDTGSGVISGTPTELSAATDYTVTATNSGGSATVTVSITVYEVASLRIIVEDATPSALSYAMNPATYTVGEAITDNMPSSTGGAVVVYSITPALPAGLSLDMGSGVISGTPTEPGEAREYTVTATNSGGSTMTVVTITVKGRHPQYTNSGPFNVAENSVNGTRAGDADAIDAAGGAKDVGVTYAVQSGNDSVDGDATPAFGLDPDTGVLTVRDQDDLDHETQSSFALVIRATDGDGFTDVIVTIQIDNVPEAPVSTGLTPVYVMIGATDSVIDLATVFSDEEDADLSYSISSNSNTELFTSVGIDEETDRLILDFALNIAGTATLEITATDSDGQSVSANLVITVSGDALEEWRHANFSAADLGDPAKEATLWGNRANPDEDLWSNAFEFFFGTDPNSFDEGYPLTYEVRRVGVDDFAVLEFERSKAVPAGAGVVEGSGDLSQWQVVNAPAVVMEDLGDRERVQVRIPLEERAKQSFVRLVIDLGMN